MTARYRTDNRAGDLGTSWIMVDKRCDKMGMIRHVISFGNATAGMSALLVIVCFTALPEHGRAQTKYIDRAGKASFFSWAPLEDIEAHSYEVVSVIDIGTGEIVASMQMRSFRFRKSLMQEHFNENYVESHKYPKASFRGKVLNVSALDINRNGIHTLDIAGDLTLHGVTRPLHITADAVVENGRLRAKAVFPISVKDFNIEIPRILMKKIAEVVEVTVSFEYRPMQEL